MLTAQSGKFTLRSVQRFIMAAAENNDPATVNVYMFLLVFLR